MILTEGTKTEPYHFEGFKKAIESTGRKVVLIEIIGVGQATTKLLPFADELIEKYHLEKADIWLLTDKDDFPDDQFNQLVIQCVRRNRTCHLNNYWHCAWSNECFELWFILHFSFYQAAATREDYYCLLKEQFRKLGFTGYRKNSPDIFDLLVRYGSPKSAIRFARKLYEEKKSLSPAKALPCTTVYELVMELARYLPSDLKDRFF